MNKEQFLIKANSKHGNLYNYDKVVLSSITDSIIVTCKIHGDYNCVVRNHLKGTICRKCSGKEKYALEEWIEKSNLEHHNKYDYSMVNYVESKSLVDIICPIHGNFKQIPNSHLSGRGCPVCKSSKGEIDIAQFLQSNNIFYIKEYRFEQCKDKKPLPFDFYLPKENICIEFDGIQHFKDIKYFKSKPFELVKKRDEIKNYFCIENNIHLIRISYKDIKNISNILELCLKKIKDGSV